MIKCFLWFVPCFFVLAGFAQKANYKEAERFMRGNAEKLVGSTKVSPRFLKESDKFWYSYKRAMEPVIISLTRRRRFTGSYSIGNL